MITIKIAVARSMQKAKEIQLQAERRAGVGKVMKQERMYLLSTFLPLNKTSL